MLTIAIASIIWSLSLAGWGGWMLRLHAPGALDERYWDERPVLRLVLQIWLGCIVVTVLAIAANFFIPIDKRFSLPVLLMGWAFFWRVDPRRRGLSILDLAVLLLIVFVVGLGHATGELLFDEGLYHMQAIKWMTYAPLPLGLTNLYSRLGYNSAWFAFAATAEGPFQTGAGLYIANTISTATLGAAVYAGFMRLVRHSAGVSDLFLITAAFAWRLGVLRNWYIEHQYATDLSSTDLSALTLTLLVIYLLIDDSPAKPDRQSVATPDGAGVPPVFGRLLLAVTLALYATTIKLSMAPLLVGALAALAWRSWMVASPASRWPHLLRRCALPAGICLLLGLAWLGRGVWVSGSLAYPSKVGRFTQFRWTVPASNAEADEAWICSWAKEPGGNPATVLKNNRWMKPWWKSFIEKRAIRVTAAMLAAGLLLQALQALRRRPVIVYWWRVLFASLTCFGGIAFWFFNAPDARFAIGFIQGYGMIVLTCGLAALGITQWTRVWRVAAAGVVVLVALVTGGAGISVQPKPSLVHWPAIPSSEMVARKNQHGLTLFVPKDRSWLQIWAGPPCSQIDFTDDLHCEWRPDGTPRMFWYAR